MFGYGASERVSALASSVFRLNYQKDENVIYREERLESGAIVCSLIQYTISTTLQKASN